MTLEAVFWRRVSEGDGCWEWQGNPGPRGFGRLQVEGRSQLARRVAWFLTQGSWPEGDVRQTCGNKLCVRPEHLVCEGLAPKPPGTARRARGSGSVEVRGARSGSGRA